VLTSTELSTRSAYDALAEVYAARFPDLAFEAPEDRALLRAFAARVGGSGPVLDLGCGTGRVAAEVAARAVRVVGLDVSVGMLATARERHPGLPLLGASHLRLPLRDEVAEGALAWYSLIHTAPDRLSSAFAEIGRVLKPGAPFLVAFQSGDGRRVDRDEAYGRPVRMTSFRHQVGDVVARLEHAGFAVQDVTTREPRPEETTPQTFITARRAGAARC
jgi:SAM-dependent methyltransferase